MPGLLNTDEREKHMSLLRDYLCSSGPCTVIEAAAATGLRPAQVSSMIADGSLTAASSSPTSARCSICRATANVGDLCERCREDLHASRAIDERGAPSHKPAAAARGSAMRSRR